MKSNKKYIRVTGKSIRDNEAKLNLTLRWLNKDFINFMGLV